MQDHLVFADVHACSFKVQADGFDCTVLECSDSPFPAQSSLPSGDGIEKTSERMCHTSSFNSTADADSTTLQKMLGSFFCFDFVVAERSLLTRGTCLSFMKITCT